MVKTTTAATCQLKQYLTFRYKVLAVSFVFLGFSFQVTNDAGLIAEFLT
jgi:hypothetical protein